MVDTVSYNDASQFVDGDSSRGMEIALLLTTLAVADLAEELALA